MKIFHYFKNVFFDVILMHFKINLYIVAVDFGTRQLSGRLYKIRILIFLLTINLTKFSLMKNKKELLEM